MKTLGDSKRKLSERKDPGASVGCYIEQGFPADAIAVELARAHSGELTASSQPGHGTRLTLTLPCLTVKPWPVP